MSNLVRDFCGKPGEVHLSLLQEAMQQRTLRASARAQGLQSVVHVLLHCTQSAPLRTTCLQFFASALRACGMHPLHKLNGCSVDARRRVHGLLGALLQLVAVEVSKALAEEGQELRRHALSLVQHEDTDVS